MGSTDERWPGPARGRIVMLVDNAVEGDSRVQKAAYSAAEAGWDVVLLGRSPNSRPRNWMIGQAQVRLIPMSGALARRRHELRRHWLIAPLGYPPTGIAEQRRASVRAWHADLSVRRALAPKGLVAARVRVETFAARLSGAWVRLRTWQTSVGKRARRRLALPSDRLYTMFWRTAMGERAWRRLEPGLWEYEIAYGPVVDDLRPDIIHANDFRMLGVGARATIRAKDDGRQIRLLWDAHEYLPGVDPWQDNLRWRPGNIAHEREFAPLADAVITVSESLAELLQRDHDLPRRPEVVLNAPDVDALGPTTDESSPSIRERCGLEPDVPLLVYSGLAAHKRGIDVMIEALPRMPDVHVALVVGKIKAPYVLGLIQRAKALGCAERLHVFGYVPHDQVVGFLSSATIGVIPIRHFPNHEIALITKFFEYSHARLPIVVSDVRTMAQTVRRTGQGEVFRVDDVDDYVRAIRAVLADEKQFRAAYDTPGLLDAWTWRAQAAKLNAVYSELMGDRPAHTERA